MIGNIHSSILGEWLRKNLLVVAIDTICTRQDRRISYVLREKRSGEQHSKFK